MSTLTFWVALLAAMECVAGRIGAMHIDQHRTTYLAGYWLAFGVCVLAASFTWQGLDARWLDVAAWGVFAHLVFSWGDWRHGPPLAAFRALPQRSHVGDLIPSGFDDRRR